MLGFGSTEIGPWFERGLERGRCHIGVFEQRFLKFLASSLETTCKEQMIMEFRFICLKLVTYKDGVEGN